MYDISHVRVELNKYIENGAGGMVLYKRSGGDGKHHPTAELR
ncbi:hypothetical protein [Paenibacillus sp. 1-18]|nr:hypothetical protein [Paenibacillus sp. 1-18]